MPAQDTTQIKEKIISFLRIRGPSLPVHIAKEIQMSMLFASAFLSELLSEKKIKISSMKVGSSPLYFTQGQEFKLERFAQYLKSKEKEAFELLKQNKFLKDSEQEPAIRVALRFIRDFAIPFKYQEEIYWRYFTIPEAGFSQIEKKIEKPKEKIIEKFVEQPIITKLELIESSQKTVAKETQLNIFDKPSKQGRAKKPKFKKVEKLKKDDKFFEKVKEFLQTKSIEILDISGFSKNELILKIKENNEEKILFAFNKKRINEKDIIKTFKKIPKNAKYSILCLGEPLKKINDLLESIKNLSDIKKIE